MAYLEEMNTNARMAFRELEKLGCPVKEWGHDDRGHFWISGEENMPEWLDYWANYWGSEKLNGVLNKYNL